MIAAAIEIRAEGSSKQIANYCAGLGLSRQADGLSRNDGFACSELSTAP